MKKIKKKARYISPRITGSGALLLSLLCNSIVFNVQVKELDNMNAVENSDEIFYFES